MLYCTIILLCLQGGEWGEEVQRAYLMLGLVVTASLDKLDS